MLNYDPTGDFRKQEYYFASQMEIHDHWNETNCMFITWQYDDIHSSCDWAEHVQNYMVMEIQEKID